MKRYARFCILAIFAAYLVALRFCAEFAGCMLARVSVPGMALLHRLTAPIPFPVAEPLALALAVGLVVGAARAPSRRRAPRACLNALLALVAAFAVLWGPAIAIPAGQLPAPGADALAGLCEALIDELNAAPLSFPGPADALARAPDVAGLPGCAVKAARYPEWMALAGAWGAFVPLTGEALADPDAPPPLVPFTAVHELMHLTGIANEGAANIAAWEKCMAAGGPFADSARLWALRYAMGLLRSESPASWQSARNKMEGALLRTFLCCGGEAEAPSPRLPITCGDYAALAGYLADESWGRFC